MLVKTASFYAMEPKNVSTSHKDFQALLSEKMNSGGEQDAYRHHLFTTYSMLICYQVRYVATHCA